MTGKEETVLGKYPLVLDFDGSVLPLDAGEGRIPLHEWQETIRFGCSWRDFLRLGKQLRQTLPDNYSCVFTGSGDFHHLTLLLLREAARRASHPGPADLVVCDNHPDNMRYPFGVHCGSWVSHAAAMPFIRHVHVLGICSPDITFSHAWENRLMPFFRRKLTYWSINRNADWLGLIARRESCHTFSSPDALIAAFLPIARAAPRVYLSVDKDVLAPSVVETNWDQGVFSESHLADLIAACQDRIIGVDICGEVSQYAYHSPFKRFLSRLDAQQILMPHQVHSGQTTHQHMNIRLLKLLGKD